MRSRVRYTRRNGAAAGPLPPYFHDGSAATLADVVEHYDTELSLGLSASEKADLTEYLRSL